MVGLKFGHIHHAGLFLSCFSLLDSLNCVCFAVSTHAFKYRIQYHYLVIISSRRHNFIFIALVIFPLKFMELFLTVIQLEQLTKALLVVPLHEYKIPPEMDNTPGPFISNFPSTYSSFHCSKYALGRKFSSSLYFSLSIWMTTFLHVLFHLGTLITLG